jgi:hypothetical protein
LVLVSIVTAIADVKSTLAVTKFRAVEELSN